MKHIPDSPAVDAATAAACSEASLNPLPEAPALPATQVAASPPAADEPAEYDLSRYRWVPVLRKPRADGWTPQRQVDFIAALADTGCVDEAAREVGMSPTSCYRLRRAPGAEDFARAWDAAIAQAARKLVDLAFDRAINGSDEPVFDKHGRRVGRRMRQNDRLLMFLLRAYMPERFRHAHGNARSPSEPPPPPEAPPVAEALRALEPEPPAEPHRLMPPEELEPALQCADIMDGVLPHWHRYKMPEPPSEAPMGPDFERQLAYAQRGIWPPPPPGRDENGIPEEKPDHPFLD